MGGLLGCGDYRVMVAKRAAAHPFDEMDFSGLSFGRVLDDISSATITLDGDAECTALAGTLREWKHEVWIFRGDEQVWRGPVTPQPTYTETQVTLPAKDYFALFERRLLEYPLTITDTDLTYLFTFILRSATVRDPHPGLTLYPALSGILGSIAIDPAQRSKAADELRTLARSGVDFTVINNNLLLGSPEFPATPLTYLTSDVVSNVSVTPLPTASEVTIIGANSGDAGKPLVATVGGVDPDVGLVVEVDNESGATTQAAVDLAANSRYDFFAGEPMSVTVNLDAAAPVDFAQLVPGAKVRLDLDSVARPVSGIFRLTKVDVGVTVSDTESTETVAITCDPLGTVGVGTGL